MPIYEYACTQCGAVEEVLQKFSEKPLTQCDHCGGRLHKLISQSTFHLKGSGWYVTDYARNKTSDKTDNKTSESPQKESGTKEKSSADDAAT
jgi:putative FmdB family regulatory protein